MTVRSVPYLLNVESSRVPGGAYPSHGLRPSGPLPPVHDRGGVPVLAPCWCSTSCLFVWQSLSPARSVGVGRVSRDGDVISARSLPGRHQSSDLTGDVAAGVPAAWCHQSADCEAGLNRSRFPLVATLVDQLRAAGFAPRVVALQEAPGAPWLGNPAPETVDERMVYLRRRAADLRERVAEGNRQAVDELVRVLHALGVMEWQAARMREGGGR